MKSWNKQKEVLLPAGGVKFIQKSINPLIKIPGTEITGRHTKGWKGQSNETYKHMHQEVLIAKSLIK